jgi:hypothetical protein
MVLTHVFVRSGSVRVCDGHLDGRGGRIEGVSERNVDLVRRGYEAALAGDLDVIAGLLDPDVSWHGGNPAAPGACHSQDEALEFMRQARARGGSASLLT